MSSETALISAAGGDFVATLTAILALFIMGTFAYFLRWVMATIPDQMQKDREAITKQMAIDREATTKQMASDREAVCNKLGEMILEMRDTKCNTQSWLEKHDDQAREILKTDTRIEATLNARPCISRG